MENQIDCALGTGSTKLLYNVIQKEKNNLKSKINSVFFNENREQLKSDLFTLNVISCALNGIMNRGIGRIDFFTSKTE